MCVRRSARCPGDISRQMLAVHWGPQCKRECSKGYRGGMFFCGRTKNEWEIHSNGDFGTARERRDLGRDQIPSARSLGQFRQGT